VTLPKLQEWIARLRRSELEVSPNALPFLAGAFYGALVIGLVWIFAVGPSTHSAGSDGPSASGGAAELADAAPTRGSTEAQPGSDRLERCREVWDAQTRPLQALRAPLSQWQVHIGAMNKLVTGVITLKQATQFWNQTRVGAAKGLARYHAAVEAFGERTARCPRVRDESLSADAVQCVESVAARARELATADRSLATWGVHVRHMEMLRKGEMTPARATQMWLASWHEGVRGLAAYRAAARQASGRTC
jgi:hypothetical protein